MEFSIPSHLEDIHKIRSRPHNNWEVYNRGEADFCYRFESLFIKPLFYKSDKVIAISKELRKADTMNKFKRTFNKFAMELFKQHGLIGNERDYYNLKLKYNQVKSYKSYYTPSKKTIFMNGNLLEKAFEGDLEDTSRFVYVLLHEMSHAIVDLKLNSDGIHCHDYFFLYILLGLFEEVSGVSKQKVLHRYVKSDRYNKPIKAFDYALHDIYMVPALKEHLYFYGKFNSLLEFKEQVKKDFDIELPIDSDRFSNYGSTTRTFNHSKDELNTFEDYSFYAFNNNGVIEVHIEKEMEYKKYQHAYYIQFLQNIYNFKNRKKVS